MESQTSLIVNTDGGSRGNPGKAGIGVVIKNKSGKILCEHGEKIGTATNNIAEYRAVLWATSWIIDYMKKSKGISQIDFFLDSLLVVQQLNGIYKIKNNDLRTISFSIKENQALLKIPIRYAHVPREQNKEADVMVNKALDNLL